MDVETGTVDDAAAVADLWVRLAAEQSAYGSQLAPEGNRAAVREEASRHAVADCLLVARDDGVVGFVLFGLSDDGYEVSGIRGVVENLYVAPDYRNRGVGSDLLTAAESALRARGVDRISLEAMAANDDARRFYRRHGYEPHRVRLEKSADSDQPGESDNH